MSSVKTPSGIGPFDGGDERINGRLAPDHFAREWEAWRRTQREHNHHLAAFLRTFADRLERDGLPTIKNNNPGWGDVVLLTDDNQIQASIDPGNVYDEPVLDTIDGKIGVIVGPRGINNCRAVLVLPLPGQTVRVRAEKKP